MSRFFPEANPQTLRASNPFRNAICCNHCPKNFPNSDFVFGGEFSNNQNLKKTRTKTTCELCPFEFCPVKMGGFCWKSQVRVLVQGFRESPDVVAELIDGNGAKFDAELPWDEAKLIPSAEGLRELYGYTLVN